MAITFETISLKLHMKLNRILICLGLLSGFTGYAQVDLQIQTSRTSGTAPLYVFFDATSSTGLTDTNDLVNTDFSWNFDVNQTDPNGSWEETKGMVAGHVFEEPGNYTVNCTAIAPDGTTDSETINITVSAFSGTTYYVSTSGNDSNTGLSPTTAWQTANHALNQLGPNVRILFNRGATFNNVNLNLNGLTGGKAIIGAYGNGTLPILSGTTDETILDIQFVDSLVISDLHLVVNATIGSSNFRAQSCTDVLCLNLEMEGSTSLAIYHDDCDKMAVFDSYIHHGGVLAFFAGDGTRMSWVGNMVDSLLGTPQPEHGMRIQRGEKQFIAHSSFSNLIETKSAIQIRGDGQRHVMIYGNKMDRILGINPSNAAAVSAISLVTIEGNYIGQNPDYTGTTWENSINGINIEATNVAARNNVIDGYRNAVNVSHDYNGVVSGWVDVYHNTMNWRAVSPQSNTGGYIVRVRDVSNVDAQNNFISAPTVPQAMELSTSGNNLNISTSNNILTDIPNYASSIPGSAAHLNDINNYQLSNNSPSIDMGNTSVPVYFDAAGQMRSNVLPDAGAFEYNDSANNISENRSNIPSLYPNPTKGRLIINHPYGLSIDHVTIINLNGQVVWSEAAIEENTSVNVSFLSKGIYMVQLHSSDSVLSHKLVVN